MNVRGSYAHQTVLVHDGRIERIGPSASFQVPMKALRIDGTGRYLIPGFADMHVHMSTTQELPLYVANGVTVLRNMNGRPAHLGWRTRLLAGQLLGPRLYTAGPIIYSAGSADEGERLVRDQAKLGYDGIKVYDGVTASAYKAILSTAKELHKPVWGHVNAAVGLRGIVESGQRSIEHAEDIFSVEFKDDLKTPTEAFVKTANDLRSPDVWVCPTLIAFGTVTQELIDLRSILSRPEMHYLPSWAQDVWRPNQNYYKNSFSPDQATTFTQRWFRHKELVEVMHEQGVQLLSGTDAGVPIALPGFSLPDELELLVEVGLSPYEALHSSTYEAALFFDAVNEWGSVQVGRSADLVVLDADPLKDIHNVRRVRGVMIRGRWLSVEQLKEMLNGLKAAEKLNQERLTRWLLQGDPRAAEYFSEEDPFYKLVDWLMIGIAHKYGYQTAIAVYHKYQQPDMQSPIASERTLNALGYRLLRDKEYTSAIAVLRENENSHPQSANACDSLGEAYLRAGNKTRGHTLVFQGPNHFHIRAPMPLRCFHNRSADGPSPGFYLDEAREGGNPFSFPAIIPISPFPCTPSPESAVIHRPIAISRLLKSILQNLSG